MRPLILIAATGWLFMLPPFTKQEIESGNFTSQNLPFSDWKPLHAYDTARDCELSIVDGIKEYPKLKEILSFGRCIPSDSIKFK